MIISLDYAIRSFFTENIVQRLWKLEVQQKPLFNKRSDYQYIDISVDAIPLNFDHLSKHRTQFSLENVEYCRQHRDLRPRPR